MTSDDCCESCFHRDVCQLYRGSRASRLTVDDLYHFCSHFKSDSCYKEWENKYQELEEKYKKQ